MADVVVLPLPLAVAVYWHLDACALILAGTEPAEANRQAAHELYRLQYRVAQRAVLHVPLGAALSVAQLARWPVPAVHRVMGAAQAEPNATARCRIACLAECDRALALPEPWLAHPHIGRVVVDDQALTRIRTWTLAAWLYATGGTDLARAVTIAQDRLAGRAHARKRPAPSLELTRDLDETMTGLWQSITTAADLQGRPYWPGSSPYERSGAWWT